MNEAAIRLDVYHALQNQFHLWPVHGRDGIICPNCHHKILPDSPGRPDVLGLNRYGPTIVYETKDINDAKGEKSLPFAQISEEQMRWLDGWVTITEEEKMWHFQPLAYLAIGTTLPHHRQLWVIDWQIFRAEIMAPAAELGKKSVGIPRLQEYFKPYELKKVTGGWEFPMGHSIWQCLPNVTRKDVIDA
jgi:hypothetical protein